MSTQTTKPVPGGLLAKEPAGTIGSVLSLILLGVWLILQSVGIEVGEDLPTAIDLIIYGLISVPAIGGWLARFFVVSPETAQAAINEAAVTGQALDVMREAVPKEKWGTSQMAREREAAAGGTRPNAP